jgi:hypothetical protein
LPQPTRVRRPEKEIVLLLRRFIAVVQAEIETATTRPQPLTPRRPLPYQNFGNAVLGDDF